MPFHIITVSKLQLQNLCSLVYISNLRFSMTYLLNFVLIKTRFLNDAEHFYLQR